MREVVSYRCCCKPGDNVLVHVLGNICVQWIFYVLVHDNAILFILLKLCYLSYNVIFCVQSEYNASVHNT